MIFNIIISLLAASLFAVFWLEIARMQKNIDLLNNYAFSSFERIVVIEQLISNTISLEDDDDDQT